MVFLLLQVFYGRWIFLLFQNDGVLSPLTSERRRKWRQDVEVCKYPSPGIHRVSNARGLPGEMFADGIDSHITGNIADLERNYKIFPVFWKVTYFKTVTLAVFALTTLFSVVTVPHINAISLLWSV